MTLSSNTCHLFSSLILLTTTLKLHSALASETTLKATIITSVRSSYRQYCEENHQCYGYREHCNKVINRCVCEQFYQYELEIKKCYPCPSEGESCMDCCSNSNLRCIDNVCTTCLRDDGDFYTCDNSQDILFMTASQIALSAALIMGAAALATLLYRICTKPSYFGSRRIRFNRHTTSNQSDQPTVSRASLTSIQVRVISRLRDRPPKYETQHNYDTRIQRQAETNAGVNTNSTRTVSASTIEHAPPAYDGSRESVHELPPPYSDTGHNILSEGTVTRPTGQPSEPGNGTISIISSSCDTKDTVSASASKSDNKEDKSIHM